MAVLNGATVPLTGPVPMRSVRLGLSTSAQDTVPFTGTFLSVPSARGLQAGSSLTALTVIETVAGSEVEVPSPALKVNESAPW